MLKKSFFHIITCRTNFSIGRLISRPLTLWCSSTVADSYKNAMTTQVRNVAMTRGALKAERKELYEQMPKEEKRKFYKCGDNFVTLSDIPPWSRDANSRIGGQTVSADKYDISNLNYDARLADKLSMFVGDICALEIDAIVNAAKSSLRGGGGVDGAIHRAAGPGLLDECKTIDGGCPEGEARVTGGYRLPARFVIHTVGPQGERPKALSAAYRNSLESAASVNARSVAFPCVSTGVYGYPPDAAALVAVSTVADWLQSLPPDAFDQLDRIVFCLFLKTDVDIYRSLLSRLFPVTK